MKLLVKLVGIASLVSAFSANAGMLVNGGFEDNNLTSGSWQAFTSNQVNGWEGSNIEIWNNYSGVDAYEGEQHAELNAHPNSGNAFRIFQTFETIVGTEYKFSFAYRARANNNEAFVVKIKSEDKSDLFSQTMNDHVVGSWKVFSGTFIAQETMSAIMFRSTSPQTHTVGNFIDDVNVDFSTSNSVSAPGALAFVLTGLGVLGFRRFSK